MCRLRGKWVDVKQTDVRAMDTWNSQEDMERVGDMHLSEPVNGSLYSFRANGFLLWMILDVQDAGWELHELEEELVEIDENGESEEVL